MHSALPPRGNHASPAFNLAGSRTRIPRRQAIIILLCLVAVFLWLRSLSRSGSSDAAGGTVMILLLNRTSYSKDYISRVIDNRQEYARLHGYQLFQKEVTDYPGGGATQGWARVPAIRHAMSTYPEAKLFWYLDQDAIIMDPSKSLQAHVMAPLDRLMRRDTPIIPPDSVIRTYRHVPSERIQFIISQDLKGLVPASMVLKNGPWAQYFLDAWYDPMYRFYNFAKAEVHALEHIVQWHPTILTKLALIPQNVFASYSPSAAAEGTVYQDGHFVVHFHECWRSDRNCEKEFNAHWEKRQKL